MEETSPRFLTSTTTEEAIDVAARIVAADGSILSSAPPKRPSVAGDGTARCCIDLPSSGLRSQATLLQDFKNFKKSSAPSRFLSFCDGSWIDFPEQVSDALRECFLAGKCVVETAIDGSVYLFDFLRMLQIESSTGARKSIAWIDIGDRCFFPRVAVDDQCDMAQSQPKLSIDIRIKSSSSAQSSGGSSLNLKRNLSNPSAEHSDESDESSTTATLSRAKWPGTEMMRQEERFYRVVEKLFLSGIRRFAPDADVTSICKCSHSGPSGNTRLQAFQMQMQMTKSLRGDANVKFGWHGAPSEGIAGVIAHGFGQPDNPWFGPAASGVGIHLSPPHSPYTSSGIPEQDENGERHLILCRIIMGNAEKVPAGSLQFHPSSDQFDNGMDDLANPKWYIVWSTRMNTHILPEYVVSFKSSGQLQGPWRMVSPAKKPLPAGISLTKLFEEMAKLLPATRMHALQDIFNQHKRGKISKEMFIRHIRSIAGDEVLTCTIKRIRGH